MTTEKARALLDTYCVAQKECSYLYLNPGYSLWPTEFLPALLKKRILVGAQRGIRGGPMATVRLHNGLV